MGNLGKRQLKTGFATLLLILLLLLASLASGCGAGGQPSGDEIARAFIKAYPTGGLAGTCISTGDSRYECNFSDTDERSIRISVECDNHNCLDTWTIKDGVSNAPGRGFPLP